MGYCYIYRSNLDTSALVVETVWVIVTYIEVTLTPMPLWSRRCGLQGVCIYLHIHLIIYIYTYTHTYIYIYIHIYIYKQISNTPWAEARPIIYGRRLMVADGRRMPMDVVELAMHEVAMRGVAMLHDCLYTLRYTPPVYIRFAISTSIRSKSAW